MDSSEEQKKSSPSVLEDISMSTFIVEHEQTEDQNSEENKGVFIMIVPQANLTCKVKSQGKSIQYHSQIAKDEGLECYNAFVKAITLSCTEYQFKSRGKPIPEDIRKSIKTFTTPNEVPQSCPPSEMFKNKSLYSSWDDSGFPLSNAEGIPLEQSLSHSGVKKLRKLFGNQKKRYEKFVKKEQSNSEGQTSAKKQLLDECFINIIPGTFGNLQALDVSADMGPFYHVIDL